MTEAEFDQFAEKYDTVLDKSITFSGEESSFFIELKLQLLRDFLKEKGRSSLMVLDYGCGTGRSFPFFQRYFPALTYHGVDPSPKSIEEAQRNYSNGSFSVLDLNSLGNVKYDLVFAAVVFHHILVEDHQKTLRALYTALHPGGRLVIFEHNPHNPLTRKVVRDCPFDKDAVLLKPTYARKMIKEAGFIVDHFCYYFFFPKWLSLFRSTEVLLKNVPLGAQYMVVGRKAQ
ncbi:TPA: class I SAM-dependent methyltransferase [Candidatus Woesearchaeota archaeon]|nr:class I SAM-dependent methyltransferase [Candidatus Woesearchaeota archaeon]